MFFDGADAPNGGPWGERYVHSCFQEDVDEDGNITIEYKYDTADPAGSIRVKWRVQGHEKVRMLRYFGSSAFAMWWCGETDGIEEYEDEEDEEKEYTCGEECECTHCQRNRDTNEEESKPVSQTA